MVAGLAGLWARRFLVDRVRYISSPSDHLMLALLVPVTIAAWGELEFFGYFRDRYNALRAKADAAFTGFSWAIRAVLAAIRRARISATQPLTLFSASGSTLPSSAAPWRPRRSSSGT